MKRSRISCENEIVHQVCEIARSPVLAVLKVSDAFKPCKVNADRGRSKRARPFASVFTEVVVRGVHHGATDRSTWTARLDMALAYQPLAGRPCNLIHAGETISYAKLKSLRALTRAVLLAGKEMKDKGAEVRCRLKSDNGTIGLKFELVSDAEDGVELEEEMEPPPAFWRFLFFVVDVAAHVPLTNCNPGILSGANEHLFAALEESHSMTTVEFSDLFVNDDDSPDWVHMLALGRQKFIDTQDKNLIPMPGRPPSSRVYDIDLADVDGDKLTTKEWAREGDTLRLLQDRPEGTRRQRPRPGAYLETPQSTPRTKRLAEDDLAYRSPSTSPAMSPAPTPDVLIITREQARRRAARGAAGGQAGAATMSGGDRPRRTTAASCSILHSTMAVPRLPPL